MYTTCTLEDVHTNVPRMTCCGRALLCAASAASFSIFRVRENGKLSAVAMLAVNSSRSLEKNASSRETA